MKIELQGLTATERFITAHVTVYVGNTMRFSQVRIPIHLLLQEDVTEAMDTAVRRRLIQAWSEIDLADPLF